MPQLYLLGGGPGGGKSTIAERLHEEYGIEYWRGDDFVDDHQQKAAAEKYPINSYINGLDEAERPLELIKFTAKQELARHEELFFMMLKELRKKKFDKLILEGNFLLPKLVKERFEYPYKAVWLIPTERFQKQVYNQRDWTHEILDQSDNPDLILKSWMHRDHQFNQAVQTQAAEAGLPYILNDGQRGIDHIWQWVLEKFELPVAQANAAGK